MVMIVDLTGTAVAAWWAPDPAGEGYICLPRVAVGDGFGALYLSYINRRAPDLDWTTVYHAPLDEIGSTTDPIVVLDEGLPSQPQRLSVSSRVVGAEIQPGAFNMLFADGRWTALWGEPVVGTPQRVTVVGDFAYWEDWQDLQRIAFGSLDQPAAWLYRADPAQIRKLNSDGANLAWVQLYFEPEIRIELWTAPVVTDAAEFSPRLVRTLAENPTITRMGDGWFAILYGEPQRIALIELETGRSKTWVAPDGWGLSIHSDAPAYVSSVEVGFHVRDSDRNDFFVRLDPRTIPWD